LIENTSSYTPHSKGEIHNQPDPTSAETDPIPDGKYKKVFMCLIASKDFYQNSKIRVNTRKGLLVVCLSLFL
jgi:hypothetical protein